MTVDCPSCGAPVSFRATLTLTAVCSHCRTILVRTDADVQAIGQSASVPYDVSPVQIGTRGRHAGKGFEVVGRLKRGWEDGFWNEWYLLDDAGEGAWLAEAQGLWLLMREVPVESQPGGPNQWTVGSGYDLGSLHAPLAPETFVLVDRKDAIIIAAEGELPFRPRLESRSWTLDFNAAGGRCATLEFPPEESVLLSVGQYVQAADLNFTQLRTLDGWRF